jgi:hypothetical protein
MIGKPICHFAPGAPATTHMISKNTFSVMTITMLCQTSKPREIKDPVVRKIERFRHDPEAYKLSWTIGASRGRRRSCVKGDVSMRVDILILRDFKRIEKILRSIVVATTNNKANQKTVDKGARMVL